MEYFYGFDQFGLWNPPFRSNLMGRFIYRHQVLNWFGQDGAVDIFEFYIDIYIDVKSYSM
jgi:hypothetical protein